MKTLIILSTVLFSSFALAHQSCVHSKMSKYDLIELARIKPFTLCINGDHSKYDAIEMIRAGVNILICDIDAYGKYDVAELLRAGANIGCN